MSRRRRAETDATAEAEPAPLRLTFLPFHKVPLSRKREIEINIVEGPDRRSVSMRLWSSQGEDRPLKPGHPIHIFATQLPSLIAALTGAAAAIGALPADWPTLPHTQAHGTRQPPTKDTSA